MEKVKAKAIMNKLESVEGLGNVYLLKEEDKDIILNMEEDENHGVYECLDRQFTLVLTHNSSFRNPEGEIIKMENERIIFPAVPFSEVNAKDVVSSSPSKEVHEFLVRRFNLKLDDEATLLIGFNL